MATTYQWSDLLLSVKPYVQNIPTSTIDAAECDKINRIIWRTYYWRWTIDDLTAIPLVDGTQDYTIADADFYRLFRARITWVTTSAVADEKSILEWLSPSLDAAGGLYDIRAVATIGSTTIRLDRAFVGGSGNTFRIDGEFQMLPTKITTTTATCAIPDDYVDVPTAGLTWRYMQLAKDPRAGGVVIDGSGRRQFTGQYASFMALLQEMKEAEDSGNAQAQRFPDNPLGMGGWGHHWPWS
mgnify:CR=1 FL=1